MLKVIPGLRTWRDIFRVSSVCDWPACAGVWRVCSIGNSVGWTKKLWWVDKRGGNWQAANHVHWCAVSVCMHAAFLSGGTSAYPDIPFPAPHPQQHPLLVPPTHLPTPPSSPCTPLNRQGSLCHPLHLNSRPYCTAAFNPRMENEHVALLGVSFSQACRLICGWVLPDKSTEKKKTSGNC